MNMIERWLCSYALCKVHDFVLQGTKAFCSGGDQSLRGKEGYVDYDNFGRLNVLDLQVLVQLLTFKISKCIPWLLLLSGIVESWTFLFDILLLGSNSSSTKAGDSNGNTDSEFFCSQLSITFIFET